MNDIVINLISGAVAGGISDISTHPLSTVKTRLQCQGAGAIVRYSNPFTAFTSIIRTEGFATLYKGVGIVVASAAPAQALYFSGYETCKRFVGKESAVGSFAAGCTAQLWASVIWVPMDIVKERLQVEGQLKTTENFGSSSNALKQIVKQEGVAGLYRAYWLHQFTWMPYNGIYFSCYDSVRSYLGAHTTVPEGLPTNVIAGLIAGTIASVTTSPLDLVKTRLQVQRSNPEIFDYNGLIDATLKIVKREGVTALFDGVSSRIMWLTPRFLVAMSMYDYVKKSLTERYKPEQGS
jgi:hypothetical protein